MSGRAGSRSFNKNKKRLGGRSANRVGESNEKRLVFIIEKILKKKLPIGRVWLASKEHDALKFDVFVELITDDYYGVVPFQAKSSEAGVRKFMRETTQFFRDHVVVPVLNRTRTTAQIVEEVYNKCVSILKRKVDFSKFYASLGIRDVLSVKPVPALASGLPHSTAYLRELPRREIRTLLREFTKQTFYRPPARC